MAKYTSRRHGEVDVKTYNVHAFSNESFNGIEIEWASSQLGFGSCTLFFADDENGDTIISIESEYMASNDNKSFIAALFEDILERAKVIE